MAVLNAPVADFVFRIVAKPFQNRLSFAANKQFIAPLPIPRLHGRGACQYCRPRTAIRNSDGRIAAISCKQADDRLSVLAEGASSGALALARSAKHCWRWSSKHPRGCALPLTAASGPEERLDEMEAARRRGDAGGAQPAAAGASCRFEGGELRLYASGTVVLDKIYLDEAPGRLAEADRHWLLLSGSAREAERFAADLRRPPAFSDARPRPRSLSRAWPALAEEVATIEADERSLDEMLHDLYGLSPDERNLVENEPKRRNAALELMN